MTNNNDIEQLLAEANQHRFFTLLNGNHIPYLHDNFGIHLAYGNNDPITDLNELEKNIGKKMLFGHLTYDVKNQLEKGLSSESPDYINNHDVCFYEPEHHYTFPSISLNVSNTKSESKINIKSRLTKEEYISVIQKLREHIIEGDCYEINFCMEFYAKDVQINPVELYKKLNYLSPMPFSALHKIDSNYLICASPERFLKKSGSKLISQPIKGTMRKGSTSEENEILKKQLFDSEKERAENLMIVDLVRNDLAKSSKAGSVNVEELFGIYDFAAVNQMISTIISEKRDDISTLDALLNAFPMGSMTGAPKHKVMQLVEKYERTKRGIYSGTIGYFDQNQDFDFNVVIRSIAYNSYTNYLSFQVGGAITYDSIPELEYEECLLKAESIMKVLS